MKNTPFTIEEVRNLQRNDCVYYEFWQNKKDGTKRYHTQEQCLVWNDFPVDEINLTNVKGNTKYNFLCNYGKNWILYPARNSYEGR